VRMLAIEESRVRDISCATTDLSSPASAFQRWSIPAAPRRHVLFEVSFFSKKLAEVAGWTRKRDGSAPQEHRYL
jgi:hypothetical protein